VSGIFRVTSGPAYGIESSFCKAAMARLSYLRRHSGEDLDRSETSYRVFLGRICGHGPLGQSQGGRFITKAHIGEREIGNHFRDPWRSLVVLLYTAKRLC
jgi:hypothetical protein